MRAWILTGTLAIVLCAVIVAGEAGIRENRAAFGVYGRMTQAVETAVDDACEYLMLADAAGKEIERESAVYAENVFTESLAAGLCMDLSVCREKIGEMTAAFMIHDGKETGWIRSTCENEEWREFHAGPDGDDIIKAIMQNPEAGSGSAASVLRDDKLFLPDETGLMEVKAGKGPSVLVLLVCRLPGGVTKGRTFVCVRNAQIRRRSSLSLRGGTGQ